MLSKIKGYLIAAGLAIMAFVGIYLKGSSDQKNKIKVKQKDIELDAYKASVEAVNKGNKTTGENNEKADNGDFSGFNR